MFPESATPETLLEMHNLRSQPRPTDSEILGMKPSTPCFYHPPGDTEALLSLRTTVQKWESAEG